MFEPQVKNISLWWILQPLGGSRNMFCTRLFFWFNLLYKKTEFYLNHSTSVPPEFQTATYQPLAQIMKFTLSLWGLGSLKRISVPVLLRPWQQWGRSSSRCQKSWEKKPFPVSAGQLAGHEVLRSSSCWIHLASISVKLNLAVGRCHDCSISLLHSHVLYFTDMPSMKKQCMVIVSNVQFIKIHQSDGHRMMMSEPFWAWCWHWCFCSPQAPVGLYWRSVTYLFLVKGWYCWI